MQVHALALSSDSDILAARLLALSERFGNYQAQFEARHDGRAVCALAFSLLYQRLSTQVNHPASRFEDPLWVTKLSENMAYLFFDAADALDEALAQSDASPPSEGVSKPWADAYFAMHYERSCVLEDLLIGLIVHIGYDLPQAVVAAGLETEGRSHIADFHRINDILIGLFEEVQAAIVHRYCPHLGLLARLAGRYDKHLAAQVFLASRALAWYNAERLLDPISARETRQSLERVAAAFIASVRQPRSLWLRFMSRTARFLIAGTRRWPQPQASTARNTPAHPRAHTRLTRYRHPAASTVLTR